MITIKHENNTCDWSFHPVKDKYWVEPSAARPIQYAKSNKTGKDKDLNQIEVSNTSNVCQNSVVSTIEHYRNIYSSPENFIKRKVDYSRMKVFDEKYRKEFERLKSFVNFPKHISFLIPKIAKAGFYYIGNEKEPDKVKCIFCQGVLSSWKKSDDPVRDHKKAFPTCPFLLNLNVGNEKYSEPLNKSATEDPDLKNVCGYIAYNVYKKNDPIDLSENVGFDIESREKTFSKFDHLKSLCLDGLFISNNEFLSCYECNKSVPILKNAENLPKWTFHFKNCSFFRSLHNEQHATTDSINSKNDDRKNFCCVEYSITADEIEARLDSRFANKVEELKYRRDIVKKVIAKKLKSTGKDYDSTYEFVRDLKDFSENDHKFENVCNDLEYFLPEQFCVVCLDMPVSVVFLPCGHLKTCIGCSSKLASCPICRQLIDKRVSGIKFTRNTYS